MNRKRKIPDLHKGGKAAAERRAKAGSLAEGSRMPKSSEQIKRAGLPGEIPITNTNPDMIKKRG